MKEKELKREDYKKSGEVCASSGRTDCPVNLFFRKDKATSLEQKIRELIMRSEQ